MLEILLGYWLIKLVESTGGGELAQYLATRTIPGARIFFGV